MNNIFQNPTLRLVIVVIIVTAISIGIVFIVRGLLTNDLDCKDGTTASPDGTKCWPNCDTGYKNDSVTGKCILDCPDGQVPIKDINPQFDGKNRCVEPCGSTGYCDKPGEKCVITSGEEICMKPNCHTKEKKLSYCPANKCGLKKDGTLNPTWPPDTKTDKAGCVTKTGKTCRSGQSSMTSDTSPPIQSVVILPKFH